MTVLAFLQNMWVNDPVRVRAIIERRGEEYRRELIHFALFRGCLSGRRLLAAFGEQVCNEIKWDEVSREISGQPTFVATPDPAHIKAVIAHYQPGIVLAFGTIAAAAVRPLWTGLLIVAPHPAARHGLTPARLREAARALELMRAPA